MRLVRQAAGLLLLSAAAALAAPATHFTVSAPSSVVVGSSFSVNVTARDATEAVDVSYAGTVSVSSSLTGTVLSDYTFTPADSGIHAFTVTLTSRGTHTLNVTDTSNPAVTGSAQINVTGITSSASVSKSPASSSYVGDAVTLRATVTSGATGFVTFWDNGTTVLGTVAVNEGRAALTTSALAAGTHWVSAEYSGDAVYNGSLSPAVGFVILPPPTPITMTCSPSPSRWKQSVTCAATAPAGATGQITFHYKVGPYWEDLGAVSLSGGEPNQASITIAGSHVALSVPAVGDSTREMIGRYLGDSTHNPGDSNLVAHTIRGVSLAMSTVTAQPAEIDANGQMFASITVHLKDSTGNNLTAGFGSGKVFLQTTLGNIYSGIDNADGTYSGSLHGAEPGVATVTAFVQQFSNQIADSETVTLQTPQIAQGMKGDFNGDNRDDVLILAGDNTVVLWLMNGVTPLGGANLGSTFGYRVVGVADFDGNGMSDILLRNAAGDIGMWFMNGATIVRAAYVANVGTSYFPVASADFDGDGKADILLRDALGNVGMWMMNGEFIAAGAFVSSPGNYLVVGVGDLNGDGKSDIILKDSAGSIGGWLMNGSTIAAGGLIGSIGSSRVAGVADLNRDGREDIVLQDRQDAVGYWAMNGTAISAGEFLSDGGSGAVPLSWVGDFDGDGDGDLLFRWSRNGELRYRHTGMSPQGGVFGTTALGFPLFAPLAFDHTVIP